MKDIQKSRTIERILFVLLLFGLAGAGFLYEIYKEQVSGALLLPLLLAYLLICYAIYRGVLRFALARVDNYQATATWEPATKEEVQAIIREVADDAGPTIWPRYSPYLIDPYPASVERFGRTEQAFVVARAPLRVVYFDDIEDNFGTATEIDGKLVDCANYDDLRVSINEALRESGAKLIVDN